MAAVPERRREKLLRVELRPGCFYALRIRRGDGLVQLSLDDGRVVKVEKEGQDQVVRVPQEVGGWIWQYEDESDRVKWNFMKLPGDPPSG